MAIQSRNRLKGGVKSGWPKDNTKINPMPHVQTIQRGKRHVNVSVKHNQGRRYQPCRNSMRDHYEYFNNK